TRRNAGKRAASFVRNSRKSHCGTIAMKRNFDGRRSKLMTTSCPVAARMLSLDTSLCGSARNRSARPSSTRIASVEGWIVSPRKSRRKSLCFSRTTTGTPARARRNPARAPAGPQPATQQATECAIGAWYAFPAIPGITSTDQRSRQLWLLPALAILFFCSGISALIYQLLWLRLLGLVFGVTTYAASTVWASFMAGLALGSIGAGRLADRVRRPLVWFGACELLIGVTALTTPGALTLLQQVYVRIYPSLPSWLPLMMLVRFAIAFAVLIVPTVLMGA